MAKQTFKVTEEDGIVRVDKHLANLFPEYSRSALAKLFTLKLIKLDGQPIQPGHKLRPGTEVEYDLGPLQEKPEVIDLPIIYEDSDVVVVNKPSGIISHARGKFWQEASVASFIRHHVTKNLPTQKTADTIFTTDESDSGQAIRAGIVHRLDRATSGVMICAKNSQTLSFLQKQFSAREVEKTYIAVVKGAPKLDSAIIDAPIARNTKDPKRFMVSATGKSSQTKYSIIDQTNGCTTLQLTPRTGRTHQLRVHLQYINLPIVGDDLYGGEAYERLLLHAHQLTITLPDGNKRTFTAPIPELFSQFQKDAQAS